MADDAIGEDKWFYFAGGKVAKSIEELMLRLKEINSEEFVFHVNGAKNDFANWIEGVFQITDLADEVRHVMEKKETVLLLKRYLHRQNSLLPGFSAEELTSEHGSSKMKASSHDIGDSALTQIDGDLQHSNGEEVEFAETLDQVAENLADDSGTGSGKEGKAGKDFDKSESVVVGEEREIFGQDLRDIAEEASEELRVEGRIGRILRGVEHKDEESHHRFIVKEFIYGFVLGLIFGLIMLGTLWNLNA
jgi:hypothetical protein